VAEVRRFPLFVGPSLAEIRCSENAEVKAYRPRRRAAARARSFWKAKAVLGRDRGFGVLVSGTTNGRSYVVQRDLPGGKTRRVTLGATNVLTAEAARKRAEVVLADLYRGIDPKAAARDRLTLRDALNDYLDRHKSLRDKSAADYRAGIERHLSSWLDQPLRSITPQLVVQRHAAIAEEVKANGRYKGESTANGVMRALRVIWNAAAEINPNLATNPVRILRRSWFAIARRERLVRPDELPKFYAAVRALPNQIAADYLTLLLFTGLRREEAASLTWDDVDLPGRVIRIPGARTKAGRKLDLPMTDFVHGLLAARRAIGHTHYVFPSNSKAGYLAEPKFFLNQVALKSGIRVSVHDLRRTYITMAESTDISPLALKALVNHSLGGGVTEGYIQMTAERLREPAQRVADRLKESIGKLS
jgi:integrase